MKKYLKIKIFCGIVMSSEMDNILKFDQCMNPYKIPYIIYADREPLIKKVDGCHCTRKRIFLLSKSVKRTEKIIFLLVFVCFNFMEMLYFLNFPSNENVRKQHLFANAYSCVNMKFSYTIALRKDEIFR